MDSVRSTKLESFLRDFLYITFTLFTIYHISVIFINERRDKTNGWLNSLLLFRLSDKKFVEEENMFVCFLRGHEDSWNDRIAPTHSF